MQVSIFLVNRISVQLRCGSAKRKLPLRALAVEVRMVGEERVEEYARGEREALPPTFRRRPSAAVMTMLVAVDSGGVMLGRDTVR